MALLWLIFLMTVLVMRKVMKNLFTKVNETLPLVEADSMELLCLLMGLWILLICIWRSIGFQTVTLDQIFEEFLCFYFKIYWFPDLSGGHFVFNWKVNICVFCLPNNRLYDLLFVKCLIINWTRYVCKQIRFVISWLFFYFKA